MGVGQDRWQGLIDILEQSVTDASHSGEQKVPMMQGQGRRFETSEYYRARAERLRTLAKSTTTEIEQATVLNDLAQDFEIIAYLVDAEESEKFKRGK